MFRWIIGSSLQFRFLVLGFAAALVLFGTIQVKKMPVDVFPEFAPPVVQVQVEALGLSAAEVESLITLNRSEEHTSELQSLRHLVCRLLLEKKKRAAGRERVRCRL